MQNRCPTTWVAGAQVPNSWSTGKEPIYVCTHAWVPGVGLLSVHEVRAETSWCGPAPMLVECMSSLAEQGFSFESLSVE